MWYPGYGNVVAATDLYLFVVTQDPTNWWQSVVRLVDITAPEGTMAPYASLRLAGRVGDKFKLNYSGGVLTTISEDTHTGSGVVTRLETFRLPDPRSAGPTGLVKLGELLLGAGERLHATRFDQDRVYVVTFLQIDPLWVVDLSEPSRPRIAGWVDVPGWSTYIEPLGERLVTVGVESGRVAVSLFDVQDPARPSLLSRVRLGENYSWSEANNDEKAFAVLAPWVCSWFRQAGFANGWTSVFSDDLNAGGLWRGVTNTPASRAAPLCSQPYSPVSGGVAERDATDRDHPVVLGELAMAWPVDRFVRERYYLLEIAAGLNGWGRRAGVRAGDAGLGAEQVLSSLAWGRACSGAALGDSACMWAEPEPWMRHAAGRHSRGGRRRAGGEDDFDRRGFGGVARAARVGAGVGRHPLARPGRRVGAGLASARFGGVGGRLRGLWLVGAGGPADPWGQSRRRYCFGRWRAMAAGSWWHLT